MVFDKKEKYYLREPRFGEDVSSDYDLDGLLDAEGNPLPVQEQIPQPDQPQGPSAIENINQGITDIQNRVDDAKDKVDQAKDFWNKRKANKAGQEALQEGKDAVAKNITKATSQKAAQAGTKVAEKAATQAIQKGATQAAARGAGMLAAGAAEALSGPVGWGIAAAQIAWEAARSKAGQNVILGVLGIIGVFALSIGLIIFAFVRSGRPGGSDLQQATAADSGAIVTRPESVKAMVENIDKITQDTEELVNRSAKLKSKASQITTLLNQLRDLRNQIEPTASTNTQATAEQLKKYEDLVSQLKQVVEPDRKALSEQILAKNGGPIRLETVGLCQTERDIKTLSVTTNAMKVILAAAEYGAANNTTIQVTCMVSGHRKYVGFPPGGAYPYCGQADTATSRTLPASKVSRHCSGTAIDFQQTDAGFVNYLKGKKDALNIRLILVESKPFHTHVEVKL